MDNSCKTPRWRLLKAQLNNLAPQAFYDRMQQVENLLLVDVRTPEEFATGHLAEAININYLADDFWDQLEQLDRQHPVFIYCRTGRRSIRACTLMRNGGFDNTNIFNLEGGFAAWQEIFPTAIEI